MAAPGAPAPSTSPAPSAWARLQGGLRRVPPSAWACLFAVLLCLPRLGSFGFWDPWELKIAEQARDVARSGHLLDPTVDGRYPGGRVLNMALSAAGIAVFGPSELGARLPLALAAVLALLAVYWAGTSLLRPRAALLATVALGTMPLFIFEARQLTSDAPLVAALALALGGLGRYAWPPDGRRRSRDLLIGLVGMALGELAGGAMIGVLLPALAIAGAVLVGFGLVGGAEAGDGTAPLDAPGVGPDLPTGRALGRSLRSTPRGTALLVAGVAVTLGLLALALKQPVAGKFSLWLGGVPRSNPPAHTFDALVRQLGFGLFPWSAVALFALARPLTRLDGPGGELPGATAPGTNPRLAFVELYLLLFAGFGFAISSYLHDVLGDGRYVALPAIALALGAFLDEAYEGLSPEPVAGLLMATGTMLIARDLFLGPEELVSVHVGEKVKWPAKIQIDDVVMTVGALTAAGIYALLAFRPRVLGRIAEDVRDAAPKTVKPYRQVLAKLVDDAGRWSLQIVVAIAILFAFYLAQVLVPKLSTHLSFKPVLESYAKFARAGDKIGKYRIDGKASTFYSKQTLVELPNQPAVVQFLAERGRVFAMVNADELAALDAALKQAKVPYYVVDASSSRFLLLTNRLEGSERDENPLRQNVWTPPPDNPGATPPWQTRVPVAATFGDAIELIGADFPATVRRPGKIPLDLVFRVKTRPPGSYKIFLHFDGPAAPRVIGDHDPVNHTFGTSFWLPGEYVRDHYETDIPLMTTPAGTYTVFMGFWPGGEGKRLKVTAGPNDGNDRVRLGTIEIK
jgi:hypothetical protein